MQRPARVLRNLRKLGGERRTMDPDHSRRCGFGAIGRDMEQAAFAFFAR